MEITWNVNLTEDELNNLLPFSVDAKSLYAKFKSISGGKIVKTKENGDTDTYRALFFDRHGYGWSLLYSRNSHYFGLKRITGGCVDNISESWHDMLKSINTEDDKEKSIIRSMMIDLSSQTIVVYFYRKGQ